MPSIFSKFDGFISTHTTPESPTGSAIAAPAIIVPFMPAFQLVSRRSSAIAVAIAINRIAIYHQRV